MSENFVDRLSAAIRQKHAPVCIGLDPLYDRLPDALNIPAADEQARLTQIETFCKQVLEIVAPITPAVKLQSAYFELYRAEGVRLYFELIRLARQLGLMVIGDVKRNDIGSTAGAYAQGHLAGAQAPDAITINGYFGADGIAPFLDVAQQNARGVFVLVRTSNPSAGQMQDFTDTDGKMLYQHIAEQLASLGNRPELLGMCSYSCLGAVVGATYPKEAVQLRKIMPQQWFLVPGYGTQGASADDCAAAFQSDGTGAIVNASRSVLYAHQRPEYAGSNWKDAVARAAKAFAEDLRNAVGI